MTQERTFAQSLAFFRDAIAQFPIEAMDKLTEFLERAEDDDEIEIENKITGETDRLEAQDVAPLTTVELSNRVTRAALRKSIAEVRREVSTLDDDTIEAVIAALSSASETRSGFDEIERKAADDRLYWCKIEAIRRPTFAIIKNNAEAARALVSGYRRAIDDAIGA